MRRRGKERKRTLLPLSSSSSPLPLPLDTRTRARHMRPTEGGEGPLGPEAFAREVRTPLPVAAPFAGPFAFAGTIACTPAARCALARGVHSVLLAAICTSGSMSS